MRLSCVAIGSNAVRMLSAGWDGHALTDVIRERRGTRLFAGLVDNRLTPQSIRKTVEAVSELAGLAWHSGAEALYVFATSAARDAQNGDVFSAACEAATRVPLEIISGEQEAIYSYIGACSEGKNGIIDIGGGSTEFTLGQGQTPERAVSLQMGAVRMSGLRPIQSSSDYEQTMCACQAQIQSQAAVLIEASEGRLWTGVGGTMTTLGAMARALPLFDSQTCEGMPMRLSEVRSWGLRLADMELEARKQVVGLMPHRADIIPAGIAILEAGMRAFSIETIRLSCQGNMDGYLKTKFRENGP